VFPGLVEESFESLEVFRRVLVLGTARKFVEKEINIMTVMVMNIIFDEIF
jgi:hypothetical protein